MTDRTPPPIPPRGPSPVGLPWRSGAALCLGAATETGYLDFDDGSPVDTDDVETCDVISHAVNNIDCAIDAAEWWQAEAERLRAQLERIVSAESAAVAERDDAMRWRDDIAKRATEMLLAEVEPLLIVGEKMYTELGMYRGLQLEAKLAVAAWETERQAHDATRAERDEWRLEAIQWRECSDAYRAEVHDVCSTIRGLLDHTLTPREARERHGL